MLTAHAAHPALRSVTSLGVATLVFAAALTPGAARTRLAQQESGRGNTPHVIYSTLLGGAEGNFDGAADVAVDSAGNAVVVGTTESSDFPTRNALQDSLEGGSDGFVAKFDANGTLVFSTFLGGDDGDSVSAVALDSTGAIYVAGSTNSQDFPVRNGFQMSKSAVADAFVAKLTSDGSSIVWASYLGGSGIDTVRDMAVDGEGHVFVTGEVVPLSGGTATFPSVNEFQATYGGGVSDAFVSVISPDGGLLGFSSLFDGAVQDNQAGGGTDRISSIAVDSASGDVYLAGNFEISEDEPETAYIGGLRHRAASSVDDPRAPSFYVFDWVEQLGTREDLDPPQQFAAKRILPFLFGNLFSNHAQQLGGTPGVIRAVFEGLCHPSGQSTTCDEPAAIGRLDSSLHVSEASNLPLLREFFFERAAADRQSAVYIAGDISSDRLSRVNAFQPAFGGNDDVVVAVLEPGTLNKAMVSFLGGDGYDSPTGIATDADGNIYVCGLTTLSTTFPTTPGALQSTPKGRNDAFLVKISPVGPFAEAPDFSLSFDPATIQVQRGTKVNVTLAIDRVGGFDGNVKVKPPAQVPGFKSPKKQSTVTGNSLVLKFKIKSDAPAGPTSFTFTGTDKDGRSRSATVTLDVQ